MYFGVDYYPEHWPEERWGIDAKMMREANINVVRLAEFAWANMETKEGRYDFSWLDRAIEILAKEGIKVILGTPTAAPPKWLMDKHPDIYPENLFGIVKGFGTRRHYCQNNETYREYSRKITIQMAEHYKGHPGIIAWQVDNELGGQCYCENCRRSFIQWLKNKYNSIEKVNEEWGTVFWSHRYNEWEEIILPKYSASDNFSQNGNGGFEPPYNHNPGLLLDFFRFSSDSIVEFQKMQVHEIRKRSNLPVTHNLMGHYSELDYFKLGKDLDFVSWDCYPNNMWGKSTFSSISMAHDLMRGIKNKNFCMMEQQSGPCGWQAMGDTPEPGQIRLWTYQSIAHGAEAMIYFRWRACTYGIEQYWYGVLDHDGIGRRRYREIKEIGSELMKLSDIIVGSEIEPEVALIKSYDNYWSHRIQPHNVNFDYNSLLGIYYDALINNNINVDVTSIEVDFSKYRLVMMPAFNLMTEEIREKCREYVKKGGLLLITFRSGTKSWNNRMTTMTLPGYFKELAGIELEEFDSINFGREVKVKGQFGEGKASIWCDVLKSNGANSLAEYEGSFYEGTPAVTVNQFGMGRVYYVGCDLDSNGMDSLIEYIIKAEGIKPVFNVKIPGVEAVRKLKDGRKYCIFLNHNRDHVRIPFEGEYTEMLTGKKVKNNIELNGYGVAVLGE